MTNKKALFAYLTDKHCCRLGRDRLLDVGFRTSIQPTIFENFDTPQGEVETQHVLCLLLGYRTVLFLYSRVISWNCSAKGIGFLLIWGGYIPQYFTN